MRISDWSSDVCSSDLNALDIGSECLEALGRIGSRQGGILCELALAFREVIRRCQLLGSLFDLGIRLRLHFCARRVGTCKQRIQGVADVVQTAFGHLSTSGRSEEHTSELQSLMRTSYAV